MADLDLLGAGFSEYDLPGLNSVAYGLINQELERGDSGLRSFVSSPSPVIFHGRVAKIASPFVFSHRPTANIDRFCSSGTSRAGT